jgi:quercetin dioxygenase-like cupin family protein
MKTWDLAGMDVQPHHPEVVCSTADGRAILIHLTAGERLDEHQVHEASWLVITSGDVQVSGPDGATAGGAGLLVHFPPNEPHEVRALSDARVLLLLTPWPGEGHPSERARADPSAIGSGRA